ncbi:hypothetical protein RRG08_009872 [Elysia crispata]|uniref:Uncharacterized protein n=1 Tax=Elysia crispata TaxID=231223 RepID=A0AAE0Z417_9GAST|nr:hypothetical protein RRG08_009872 [Elysia crispata]
MIIRNILPPLASRLATEMLGESMHTLRKGPDPGPKVTAVNTTVTQKSSYTGTAWIMNLTGAAESLGVLNL